MKIHYDIRQVTRYVIEHHIITKSAHIDDDVAQFWRRDTAESTLRSLTADLAGWEKDGAEKFERIRDKAAAMRGVAPEDVIFVPGEESFKIKPVTRYILERVANDETGAARADICEFQSHGEAFAILKTMRDIGANEDAMALAKRGFWLNGIQIDDNGNFQRRA